jgi:release factor glutamine methyltransferase
MDDTITWAEMLAQVSSALGDEREARWLCEHAAGMSADEFRAALNEPVRTTVARSLETMVARRRAGEPLQYVMRSWAFRRLEVMVDERVLIPRPETETLAELALAEVKQRGDGAVVVDLGTGSGVIGLSIAAETYPQKIEVWLTDDSADALDVARANLAGIGRAGSVVRVAEGSWYSALPDGLRGGVQVVVANPPYIAEGDVEVEPGVHEWEPHHALYSGASGLDAIREIITSAPEWLAPGGVLFLEMGYRQADAVRELFDARWSGVVVHHDLAGRDRFVEARLGE